jgi:hypothetical protein
MLELRQIEVRAAAASEQLARVVEEEQAEVEQRCGRGCPSTSTCRS